MESGIYQIINIFNGKIYIGSSVNLKNRKSGHFYNLKNNKHHSIRLQSAFNKYKKSKFKFEIIELVPKLENESKIDFNKRLVNEKEQHYLDTLLFAQETGLYTFRRKKKKKKINKLNINLKTK